MQLPPIIYHSFIRPKWTTRKYIHNHIQQHFDFTDKKVLDFGAGTGANCTLFSPAHYLGIDPDAYRIKFAKRVYSQYRFEVFKENELLEEDNAFDFILIIAVLHHIPPDSIQYYVKQFKRMLKPGGEIVLIEPCFFDKSPICNWFMNCYDKGDYVRREDDYLNYFIKENFHCNVLKRFNKFFLYNELYFTASL